MAQWRWREVRKALDILRADEQLYAVELHGVKVTKVLRCKLGSKAGASNNDVKEAQPDPARPALTSRQRRSAQRKRDFLQAKREPTAAAAVAAAAAAAAPAEPAAPAAVATTERGTLADAKLKRRRPALYYPNDQSLCDVGADAASGPAASEYLTYRHIPQHVPHTPSNLAWQAGVGGGRGGDASTALCCMQTLCCMCGSDHDTHVWTTRLWPPGQRLHRTSSGRKEYLV